MAILHLQRRLREVGRIRLGQLVTTSSGKKRPDKLDRFRLTSRDQRVIDAAAQVYGGTPAPWAAPDGQQYELVTETLEMPVIVPPGDMAFSQWMELWSAGGCQRRCDGVHDYISDGPCVCDPDNRECATTTRLNVMLPEVPGFGLWRLESHGYYAAVELAGVVELCRQATEAGHMLPARLRLEQRQVKRFDKDGKPQTLKFAVPALDLDVSVGQLGALTTGVPVAELAKDTPALPSPGWTPVPVAELPEGPGMSVREQVAAVDVPHPPSPRANAAAPLPATGLKPRTAVEAETGETVELAGQDLLDGLAAEIAGLSPEASKKLKAWWRRKQYPTLASGGLSVDQVGEITTEVFALDDTSPPSSPSPSPKKAYFARHAKAAKASSCTTDELRERLVGIVTDGATTSAAGWGETDDRWLALNRLLDRIEEGGRLHLRATGGWEVQQARRGKAAT